MALMRSIVYGNQWGQTLTLKQAQEFILQHGSAVNKEQVPLRQSLNRVLANDVLVPEDMPAFAVALTDGYAIRHKDAQTQNTIPVTRTPALDDTAIQLPMGSAAQIIQGARLPMGADTVIRPDQCMYAGYQLRLNDPIAARSNSMAKAEFARQGHVIMQAGQDINNIGLATLAELGVEQVDVFAAPTISAALFSQTPEDPLACHCWLAQAMHGSDADWYTLPAQDEEISESLVALVKDSDSQMLVLGGDMDNLDWARVQKQLQGGLNQVILPDGQHILLGELAGKLVLALPLLKQDLLMAATWLIQPLVRQQLGRNAQVQEVPVSRKLENPSQHERLLLAVSDVGSRGLRLKACKGEAAGSAAQATCANGVVLIAGRSEINIGQKAEFLSFLS